jgi:putative ABC transport system permease protein
VAGRGFHGGDFGPASRTVIVNEAFVRGFRERGGGASPIGVRLRIANRSGASTEPARGARQADTADASNRQPATSGNGDAAGWFEIVGVVRDLGLDPGEEGDEAAYVFSAASAATVSPLAMSVRVRGNPAPLVARLPMIAAGVDARLRIEEAWPLSEWIRKRDVNWIWSAGSLAGVTALVLLLSAMGIFSLMSVNVSRRTREIGLRAALGASRREVIAGIVGRALVLMGSGIAAGGALVLLFVAMGGGPSGRPADDVPTFAIWLAVTSAVMIAACLLACIAPAARALRINPMDALREN